MQDPQADISCGPFSFYRTGRHKCVLIIPGVYNIMYPYYSGLSGDYYEKNYVYLPREYLPQPDG